MRRCLWLLLLPILSAVSVVAQGYDPMPKLVAHARYILVTTYSGDDLSNYRVTPDDRQAVVNVQNSIKKWGRFALAYNAKDADLILLVRKGRIVESMPGIRIGAGSDTKPGVGAVDPTDVGDPRDMLALYDAANGGVDSAPLWRDLMKGGLNPPQMPLMGELRDVVDSAGKVP